MSSKSDRDNRSNQLNPNNSAYDSSRAGNQRDDDDDWEDASYVSQNFYRPPPASTVHVVGQYGVGVVSQEGQARFVTFSLEACDASGLFLNPRALLQSRIEDYFERFANHVHWLFRTHFKAQPALYVQFDGTSGRLPWHVPLNVKQPETMRDFLRSSRHAPAPSAANDLLCDRLREPSEDWGTFTALDRNTSDLIFIYEQRCTTEIQRNSLK